MIIAAIEQPKHDGTDLKNGSLRNSEEFNKEKRTRDEFLESIGAVPVPPELYALWVYARLYHNPGSAENLKYSINDHYPTTDLRPGETNTVDTLDPIDKNGAEHEKSYCDSRVIWMPTKDSDLPVPTGHGAASFTLLYIDGLTNLETRPDSRGDDRPRLRYGHNTLLRLSLDPRSPIGIRAKTNSKDVIRTYPEINDLIAGFGNFSPEELVSDLKAKISSRQISMLAIEDQRKKIDEDLKKQNGQ